MQYNPHRIYDEIFINSTYKGRKISVIGYSIHPKKMPKICSIFLIFFQNFYLTLKSYYVIVNGQTPLIREFSNISLLILYPINLPIINKQIFNINHNLIGYKAKKISISFKILIILKYQFLMLDGKKLKKYFNAPQKKRFLTSKFPLIKSKKNNFQSNFPINIGIVGSLREEKNEDFDGLLILIKNHLKNENFNFIIGYTNENDKNKFHDLKKLKFINTSKTHDYFKFLNMCDFTIILAKKERYYFRHSGTIMDSIKSFSIPIVPNLPVFVSQISDPLIVGLTYENIEKLNQKLPILIKKKFEILKNYREYFEIRSKKIQL